MEVLGPEEVCAKYAITTPAQVIDLLGLMGDAADNIPGCPGVGEKTAQRLIGEFGGIDGLLQRTGELKGALRKKVEDNAEKIRFSKYLVTIRTDVPIDVTLDALRTQAPDEELLKKLFEEQEFRSLVQKKFPSAGSVQKNAPIQRSLFDEFPSDGQEEQKETGLATLKTTEHEYHLVDSVDEMRKLCDFL